MPSYMVEILTLSSCWKILAHSPKTLNVAKVGRKKLKSLSYRYFGYNGMVKKPSHATFPLKRETEWKFFISHCFLPAGKENLLRSEIRPSPTGVAGAERIPPRGRRLAADNTWLETDIDGNVTRDRGPEADQQRRKETQVQLTTILVKKIGVHKSWP